MLRSSLFASILGLLATSNTLAAPSYYGYEQDSYHNNEHYGKHEYEVCRHHVANPTWDEHGRGWGHENGRWCLINEHYGYDSHEYSDYQEKPTYDHGYDYEYDHESQKSEYGHYKYFAAAPARPSKAYNEDYGASNGYDQQYDIYKATMCGEKEIPTVIKGEPAFGHALVLVNRHDKSVQFVASHFFAGALTKVHIHGPATPQQNASVIFNVLPSADPNFSTHENPVRNREKIVLNEEQHKQLASGLLYVNLHNAKHPDGAIRGQLLCASKECEAPHGVEVARFFEDGICNQAIFEHHDKSFEYY